MQIAFNGHAHSYQRNFADPNGLLSYTTGTGGAIALTVGGPTGNGCSAIDAYAIGWDTYGQSGPANTGDKCGSAPTPVTPGQVYHYLKVTIDGKKVTSRRSTRSASPSMSRPTTSAPSRRPAVVAVAAAATRLPRRLSPTRRHRCRF